VRQVFAYPEYPCGPLRCQVRTNGAGDVKIQTRVCKVVRRLLNDPIILNRWIWISHDS
jgi:hypothetical protein